MPAEEADLIARLNSTRGIALAAMLCIQQLVRVMIDRKLISGAELNDVIGEVLSAIKISEANTPDEIAVAISAERIVLQCFDKFP
jgi:hypothetical protein